MQGRIEGALFEDGPLTEPGRVHAVLGATCTALVIDVLGDSIEQAPSCALRGFEFSPLSLAVVERLDAFQSSFVGET